jgi:Putative lumazine-binding
VWRDRARGRSGVDRLPSNSVSESDAASEVEAMVRAYLDAAARLDHEALCRHLCDGARAIALVEAADRGFETDSCAAAMAHIMPARLPSDGEELLAEAEITVLDVEKDRATVSLWTDAKPDQPVLMTVVRERDSWKIGVTVGGNQTADEVPTKTRRRSERSTWLADKNAQQQP